MAGVGRWPVGEVTGRLVYVGGNVGVEPGVRQALHLHTNPFMLFPVHPLMLCRTVLHKLAPAAQLPMIHLDVHTILRALAAPATGFARGMITVVVRALPEADVAVYPVAHFPLAHALELLGHLGPILLPLRHSDLQNWGRLEPPPGEPDHLTVVCATWIWTACGVVVENVLVGDVGGVGEEDLGV